MSKLREAAQAVAAAESMGELAAALDALRDALAEDALNEMQSLTESEYREPEYELWGRVTGGPGSRWPIEQIDGQVWPVGTALYVRVEKSECKGEG